MRADPLSAQFVSAGPEQLLGIEPKAFTAERGEATMATGPWLLDSAAGVVRSVVGVALDDVTGHVVAMGAPTGLWPVSLSIRLDFLADLPTDGSALTVTGDVVHRGARSGTTRGRAVDVSGGVVALVTQRSHLVEYGGPVGSSDAAVDRALGDHVFRDYLRFGPSEPGASLVMSPSTLSANEMGNTHGGILIAGSELAAMDALGAAGNLRTSSIDITYVRPGDGTVETVFDTEIVHRGRSAAVVRVTSRNSSGKPCSFATVTVQPGRVE